MRFPFFLCCALPLCAWDKAEGPAVDVFVPHVGFPMNVAFYQAEGIATRIFAGIGVRVRWRAGDAGQGPASKRAADCVVGMALSWKTPDGSDPGALAFSKPYDAGAGGAARVTVFMDRIKPVFDQNPTESAFLMGHVLAHELGHVLQGITRHSDAGVLKQQWSPGEIQDMPREILRFTSYDKTLILDGIRTRCGPK